MVGGASAGVRLELLGPGRVLMPPDGVPLDVPPSVLHLLAYLVLHRSSPQHRDVVAATLWPDVTDDRARRRLSTVLWRMRRGIEGPAGVTLVTVDGAGRVVVDLCDVDIDVVSLEHVAKEVLRRTVDELTIDHVAAAHDVLDVCRGEILSGRYDEWLLPDRDRLVELRQRLVGRLAVWYARRCEPSVAIAAVAELLVADAGNEPAHRVLIELYARTGEPALARRQLERCRRALSRELGIDPSPATCAAAETAVLAPRAGEDPLEELYRLSRDLAGLQERLVQLVDTVRLAGRDGRVTPR